VISVETAQRTYSNPNPNPMKLPNQQHKAQRIVKNIYNLYAEFGITEATDEYHDTMLYQLEGARDELSECFHEDEFEDLIPALEDALKYMKAISKVIKLLNNLPRPIFG